MWLTHWCDALWIPKRCVRPPFAIVPSSSLYDRHYAQPFLFLFPTHLFIFCIYLFNLLGYINGETIVQMLCSTGEDQLRHQYFAKPYHQHHQRHNNDDHMISLLFEQLLFSCLAARLIVRSSSARSGISFSSHTDSLSPNPVFCGRGDAEERRMDRAACARVASFVFLFATVRCYAILHSFSFWKRVFNTFWWLEEFPT